MRTSTSTPPPKLLVALAVVAALVVAAAGWLLVVSPKRSERSTLDAQIAEAQTSIATRLAQASADTRTKEQPPAVKGLKRALPDFPEIAGLIRNVDRVAGKTGIVFSSITPSAPVAGAGYDTLPMTIVVDGRYFAVRNFVRELRKQVQLVNNGVRAKGRLYDVQTLELEQTEPAPQIRTTLTLNAFVFKSGQRSPAAPPPATGTAG